MSPADRGRILIRLTALIERESEELARLESQNNGKPIRESREIDIPLVVDTFEYYAGFSTKLTGRTLALPAHALGYTTREPLGVVGAITPFNFPLMVAAWKLAPALAFGNAVVIKPSPETPLTTLRLGELLLEAGVPDGVVTVVTGGRETGEALVDHPGVDGISFTGSTSVGRTIAAKAGEQLKRLSLELGGKGPNIVFDDADLEHAVAGSLFGVFWTQGEICTSGARILVHRSVYDTFAERFVERTRRLRIGDPLDEATQVGPLVSTRQRDIVMGHMRSAAEEGARLLVGGGTPPDPGLERGNYVQPTVFGDVRNDMRVAREEIFGPVATLIPFSTTEEAIVLANDTPYGLSAGVWTRDIRKAHLVARGVRAGTVWVNSYNQIRPEAPFGGFKASGWGRENGYEAADFYTEAKHVYVELASAAQDWFA
jgi:acyl-CoA reductase-like NAD-dependent aldehyde dehydrogenase